MSVLMAAPLVLGFLLLVLLVLSKEHRKWTLQMRRLELQESELHRQIAEAQLQTAEAFADVMRDVRELQGPQRAIRPVR